MTEPWDTDRDLDAGAVIRTLRCHFQRLTPDSVEYLGSGWDYDAYLVAETVVRFPRQREVAERLDREDAILRFVSSALGSDVAVPRITLWGEPGPDFPYRFFGHRLLPGMSADDPRAAQSEELAADLGRALTAVHSIPRPAARDAGFDREEETCRERYEETLGLLTEVVRSSRCRLGRAPGSRRARHSLLSTRVRIDSSTTTSVRTTSSSSGALAGSAG